MLKRRSFLGMMLGLAATPVLAKLEPLYEAPPADLIIGPPIMGLAQVHSICIAGLAKHTKLAEMRLMRSNGAVLLNYGLNAYGGQVRHTFCPGQEIVFTPEHPLLFENSHDLDVRMLYSREGTYRMRRMIGNLLLEDNACGNS